MELLELTNKLALKVEELLGTNPETGKVYQTINSNYLSILSDEQLEEPRVIIECIRNTNSKYDWKSRSYDEEIDRVQNKQTSISTYVFHLNFTWDSMKTEEFLPLIEKVKKNFNYRYWSIPLIEDALFKRTTDFTNGSFTTQKTYNIHVLEVEIEVENNFTENVDYAEEYECDVIITT